MKNSILLKIYLFVSGALLTVIGGLTTFKTVNIKADEGIEIAGNASALNDVRSFGMLLLATAIILFIGGVKSSLRKSATISAVLLFLSLAIGRLLSILMDGMPSDGIVKATGLEFILGTVGLILFLVYREKQSQQQIKH